MQSIQNIADWFLSKESMTHKKLQKLCYYAQAWHLALLDAPLFSESFQAWVHGPVSPVLYAVYADYGWLKIPMKNDEPKLGLSPESIRILESVWETYGKYDGDELESMTHAEKPWIETRGDLKPWETCTAEITQERMRSYHLEKWHEAQND